ncbi:MAG: hypothetical protein PHH00_03930 [Candidatus Nanoarchaeia archaeon]|nr:hypothetical protein [Candidatus Nanoarchaeia archaeon]
MANETTERYVIKLVAMDRIEIPISSLSGKLKKGKPKFAASIPMPASGIYSGERVYARVESEDLMKARKLKDAVADFVEKYPNHGKVLQGMIAEKRLKRETHMYFGTREGCKLTADDYIEVMTDLGFTETRARDLYPELMAVSQNLRKKRKEKERRVMIGGTLEDLASGDEDDEE